MRNYRPTPPAIIADLLLQLAGMDRADHVVDLGCGTGLSALMWLNRTSSFTGVEPSSDMRAIASRRPEWLSTTTHAQFVAGEAHQTALHPGFGVPSCRFGQWRTFGRTRQKSGKHRGASEAWVHGIRRRITPSTRISATKTWRSDDPLVLVLPDQVRDQVGRRSVRFATYRWQEPQ